MHVQTYVCSKEHVLYNGAYSTCSGLTHLNLFCEDVFESVNVDQSELCMFKQTGRQGGWQERQQKESDHHICIASFNTPSIPHTHTHTHTHAPLFFANLSPLPSLPLPTCRTCTHPTHRGSKVLQHLFLFLCLDSLHTSGSRATWTQLTEHRETVTHRAYSRGSSEQISEWGYKTEDRGQRTEME